jgi:hypothetical protein
MLDLTHGCNSLSAPLARQERRHRTTGAVLSLD